MAQSNEIIVALIGVMSALSVVVMKDIVWSSLSTRFNRRRALLQVRLEHAYVPLEYLFFSLLRANDGDQERLLSEIGTILKNHGHLLSESSLSAFYCLLDDIDTGVLLLQSTFVSECVHLKQQYYRHSHMQRLIQ